MNIGDGFGDMDPYAGGINSEAIKVEARLREKILTSAVAMVFPSMANDNPSCDGATVS